MTVKTYEADGAAAERAQNLNPPRMELLKSPDVKPTGEVNPSMATPPLRGSRRERFVHSTDGKMADSPSRGEWFFLFHQLPMTLKRGVIS